MLTLQKPLADDKEAEFNEKICLIEDIYKTKRLMFGFGFTEEEPSVVAPETIFNTLYEQSIEELSVLLATISAQLSIKAREMAGFINGEIPVKHLK